MKPSYNLEREVVSTPQMVKYKVHYDTYIQTTLRTIPEIRILEMDPPDGPVPESPKRIEHIVEKSVIKTTATLEVQDGLGRDEAEDMKKMSELLNTKKIVDWKETKIKPSKVVNKPKNTRMIYSKLTMASRRDEDSVSIYKHGLSVSLSVYLSFFPVTFETNSRVFVL